MASTPIALALLGMLVFGPLVPVDGGGCEVQHVPHLGPACRLPNGDYRVFLEDGSTLLTHGPDPVPSSADLGFEVGDEVRPPVCADDWNMHVLYGHPSGQSVPDGLLADLEDAVGRMNALLNAEALESGGVEADYKIRCKGLGEMRIDTFEGPAQDGPDAPNAYTLDFAEVVDAAQAAGFEAPGTDYLIFYNGTSEGVCGVGNLARDDSLSDTNANLLGPDYGVVYAGCWFGRTPMHENGHTQGAVQDFAPDWDLNGHCIEGQDIMCYPTQYVLVFCPDRVHFDCDHDTYFDAEPEEGEWLESHWNLGSRLNRYVAFGDQPPPVYTPEYPEEDEEDTEDEAPDADPAPPEPEQSAPRPQPQPQGPSTSDPESAEDEEPEPPRRQEPAADAPEEDAEESPQEPIQYGALRARESTTDALPTEASDASDSAEDRMSGTAGWPTAVVAPGLVAAGALVVLVALAVVASRRLMRRE